MKNYEGIVHLKLSILSLSPIYRAHSMETYLVRRFLLGLGHFINISYNVTTELEKLDLTINLRKH